ncbi:MAG TPA: hypothetical protein VMA73_06925 [Streptosporangiaceae bacterium]|nr:hypothetical protein [Streptosporangiaceae bacterium]
MRRNSARPTVATVPAIRAVAAGLLGLAAALPIAGCGSTPATSASVRPAAGISTPALATALAAPDGGANWAVLEMGGSAAQHNNFWELFARPAGGSAWKLATPVGVASNGGIVATVTGSSSLLAGVRPSQDLKYSPLAQTANAGTDWSQNNILEAGLADLPTALAAGPSGRLLAVIGSGDIDTSSGSGVSWSRLTTQRALDATPAGRACGITAVTAAGWTPAGDPLLGGDCLKHGIAGIFTAAAGTWRAAAPTLPAALAGDPVSVIGLNTTGTRTTAVLAVGTGAATGVIAAWSANGGGNWTLSPELRTGPSAGPSVSFGADGSATLVLPGKHASSRGQGATISWQSATWQQLPTLPAYTATIAATQSGTPEALAARGGTLTVWQLPAAGSAGHWQLTQTVHVAIPYGSSS